MCRLTRADFLLDRIVDGPYQAIEGLQTEDRFDASLGRMIKQIVGGTPTWSGQGLEACQGYIITYGWSAFEREMQQQVKDVEGALWTQEGINATRVDGGGGSGGSGSMAIDLMGLGLSRAVVAVDPASSSRATSNETGIIGCGRTAGGLGYVLADRSGTLKPAEWGRRAVLLHDEIGADSIVGEKNQGGEMVEDVIRNAAGKLFEEGRRGTPHIEVILVHASRGKRARAEPVAQMYDEHAVHHVGAFPALEDQMTTWNASDGSESPDRVDALVWGLSALGIIRTPSEADPFVAIG